MTGSDGTVKLCETTFTSVADQKEPVCWLKTTRRYNQCAY